MNDLDLLRDFGDQLDRAAPTPPARLRARVLSCAAAGSPTRLPRKPFRHPSRWLLPVGAAVATAGMVLSVVQPGWFPGGSTAPAPGLSSTAFPQPPTGLSTELSISGSVEDGQPMVTLNARQILLAAAGSARTAPALTPDPNAFVYTRTKEIGTVLTDDGHGKTVLGRRYDEVREAWLSVDGRRDGAVTPSGDTELYRIPGCPDPAAASSGKDGGRGTGSSDEGCPPNPAYLPDLPTDPAAALAHLRTQADGRPTADDGEAFTRARDLVQERLIQPAARAAIFEALAKLNGVEVVQRAVTVTGRAGVAVGMRRDSNREEIVFDPKTYEVIGERDTVVDARVGVPVGTVLYASSILQQSVVDAVRHRPDGTWRKGRIHG